MNIQTLTPKSYNNNSLTDQNYINIVNFTIPAITLSKIFFNGWCSSLNSQCIFKNINMTDYYLGFIVWNEHKFPEDYGLAKHLLYYILWNDIITQDMTDFLQYIDYKKNHNIEDKKTYINVLIKIIYNLLHLIKNNINHDPVNIKIQLNKIMELI